MRGLAVGLVFVACVACVSGADASLEGIPGVTFDDSSGHLVIVAPTYRLTLDRRDGRIVDVLDRASGARIVHGAHSCLWRVEARRRPALRNACAFAPRSARRFSYRWSPASAALALTYRDPVAGSAVVTIRARRDWFDLQLTIRNRGPVLTTVSLPGDLLGDVRAVEAGYAPNVLPGVRLRPGFFRGTGNTLQTYPSRWAFADYLAVDAGGGHLAVYSVNRGPVRPVTLGFLRQAPPGRCSGTWYCVVHQFQTWVTPGATWASPTVRVRLGQTVQESILAYRHDNGIDGYPSVQDKVGADLLRTLARSPLIKADLVKLGRPFADWYRELPELPSPALLHPVAFQPGGHDENGPDFLPPDPRWGTTAELASTAAAARSAEQLLMPYLNVSWWSAGSPTLRSLPPPLATNDIAVLDMSGEPVIDTYGSKAGVVVSPFVPFVRARVDRLLEEWRTEVPADCLFFDQLGARPWIRDFNPASPRPEAYYDGWLALLQPYADRCLMVEDGWDRLARAASGFHGSLLMMEREHGLPTRFFGAGNWEPYPLATWLLHDKVLLYQHDLYDETMTGDDEVLTWNLAFGMIGSYRWTDGFDSGSRSRLELVGELQRALGPYYAGVPLASYRTVADDLTESTFGELVVLANHGASARSSGAFGIAANGFLARARDDSVLAGAFAGAFDGVQLSEGTHHVIVERDEATVTVRQPVGADTELAVTPPRSWNAGRALRATAIARDGSLAGPVAGTLRDGRFVFRYAAELNDRAVAAYRISLAG